MNSMSMESSVAPRLDLTNAYRRTLLKLFDQPQSSSRKLKADLIQEYLAGRWLITAKSDESRSPFWLSTPGGGGARLDLADFLIFVIDGVSHDGSWFFDPTRLPFLPLSIGEQQELLECAASAAGGWSLVQGRLHPGLYEILKIAAGLISSHRLSKQRIQSIDPEPWYTLLSRLVDDVTRFEPDEGHWPTVSDVGRVFELFTHFFLSLSNELTPYDLAGRLATRAWKLIWKDTSRRTARGYLDLIDGDLLPWGIVHAQMTPGESVERVLALAAGRFEASANPNIAPDEMAAFSTTALDEQIGDDATASCAPSGFEAIRYGCYSFKKARRLGGDLASKLSVGIVPDIAIADERQFFPPPSPRWTDIHEEKYVPEAA